MLRTLHPSATLICIFLMIAAPLPWSGCGTPVDPGVVTPTVTLSAASVQPGEFFTITHPDILAGWPVEVRFAAAGYELTYTANMTTAGHARLPAPPFIDSTTGAIVAGDVKVTLVGLEGEAYLTIEGLPVTQGATPGAAVRVVLEEALEEHYDLLDKLAAFEAESGVTDDSTQAGDAAREVIDMLEAMIDEYDATGQMTLAGADGSSQVLTSTELQVADQWLAAMFNGLSDELSGSSTGAKAIGGRHAQDNQIPIDQQVRDGIEKVRQSIQTGLAGSSTLMAGVGLAVTLIGLKISAPILIITGAFAAVGGAACSFANGALGGSNSDSFLNNEGDEFSAGQEALSQSIRYGADAVSAVPGTPGLVATGVSAATATWDAYNNGRNIECVTDGNTGGQKIIRAQAGTLDSFCDESEPQLIDNLDGIWHMSVGGITPCLVIEGGIMVSEQDPCGYPRYVAATYPIVRNGSEVIIRYGSIHPNGMQGDIILRGTLLPGGHTITGSMTATISSDVFSFTMTRE